MRTFSNDLNAIARTTEPIDTLKDTIAEFNQRITDALGALFDTLNDANNSEFADGTDWTAGILNSQDEVAEAFNKVLDDDETTEDRLSTLKMIADRLTAIRENVKKRIEHHISSLIK